MFYFVQIWKCSRDEGTSTLSNHHVSYLVCKCLLSLELLGQSTRTLVDVWDNSLTHY